MQKLISEIIIGERARKDMGDIASLAQNIAEIGLLHPVVISKTGDKLIAGERRIRAYQLLGWTKIPVTVVDLTEVARGERAENLERKDFTLTEAVAIKRAVEPMLAAEAKARQAAGGELKSGASANLAEAKGDTRDKVAKHTGKKRTALAKAEVVVAALEAEPDNAEIAGIVETMDATGNVNGALRALKERDREARRTENREKVATISSVVAADAKFATIVIDPPWDWGDEGDQDQLGRAKPDYATMTIEQLMDFTMVSDHADTDCHLYMCITNRSLPKGFALLERWGFRYVTMLTWVKPSYGMGNYFRGQTEHILFGVKGSQMLKRKDIGTAFPWPRGPNGHSSKPVEMYEMVESASPGPYFEIFSRHERPDWTSWGEDSRAVAA
jgi:ParB/RepB/Spo0J family partition protein